MRCFNFLNGGDESETMSCDIGKTLQFNLALCLATRPPRSPQPPLCACAILSLISITLIMLGKTPISARIIHIPQDKDRIGEYSSSAYVFGLSEKVSSRVSIHLLYYAHPPATPPGTRMCPVVVLNHSVRAPAACMHACMHTEKHNKITNPRHPGCSFLMSFMPAPISPWNPSHPTSHLGTHRAAIPLAPCLSSPTLLAHIPLDPDFLDVEKHCIF
jgi:hypothetical protein